MLDSVLCAFVRMTIQFNYFVIDLLPLFICFRYVHFVYFAILLVLSVLMLVYY